MSFLFIIGQAVQWGLAIGVFVATILICVSIAGWIAGWK